MAKIAEKLKELKSGKKRRKKHRITRKIALPAVNRGKGEPENKS